MKIGNSYLIPETLDIGVIDKVYNENCFRCIREDQRHYGVNGMRESDFIQIAPNLFTKRSYWFNDAWIEEIQNNDKIRNSVVSRIIALRIARRKENEEKKINLTYKKKLEYFTEELHLLSSYEDEVMQLDSYLTKDYLTTFSNWFSRKTNNLNPKEFLNHCISALWCEKSFKITLDLHQAHAVAEQASHLLVTARAGSGKTRTLVTRILFQIKHCRIDPKSILALAFNRDAAKEIRERLLEHLSGAEMPYVMTFHALACNIVQPNTGILFDEKGHDSKKLLSQTIKGIIEKRFENEQTTTTLQRIMGIQWENSLTHLIKNCLNKDEISKELEKRETQERALDLRRVDSAVHKWICNYLLWHDIDFKYHKTLHHFGGDSHKVAFLLTKNNIIIETSPSNPSNATSSAFNKSEKAEQYRFINLVTSCDTVRKDIHLKLKRELNQLKIPLKPLSKEQLWEKIKSKQIEGFTTSIQQFIARCQKELMWPDDLARAIQNQENAEEIQRLFWNEALEIYRDYESELKLTQQTDFDRLLLSASKHIELGNTTFNTGKSRPRGDLRQVKHLLIDEFQDFSHLFHELRKSILTVTPDVNMFCVGDDWQAINRFAGSNVNYFHSYVESFPNVQSIELQTNYRSSMSIVGEGNRIMKGHGNASIAHKTTAGNIFQITEEELSDLTVEEEILLKASNLLSCQIMRIAQASGMPLAYLRDDKLTPDTKRKVVVLSRNSWVGGMTLTQWQNILQKYLPDGAKEQIELSTSHGYKGQEADTVILLHPEKYPLVHPDSIFASIFGETALDLELDERRLFYVATTRAETNLIYLRGDPKKLCAFVPGINKINQLDISQIQPYLLSGDMALIEIKDSPSSYNSNGTYRHRDAIHNSGFNWKKDKKAWVQSVASEQVQISKSVIALLRRYSWVHKIEQVDVKVSTPTLTYHYALNKRIFKRLDAKLTPEQQAEIGTLKETLGDYLAEAVEAILLDLKQDWPDFGLKSQDGMSILEVAWTEDEVGLYHPDDDVSYFKKHGWRLIPITAELRDNWEKDLLPCFNSKASARVQNEGIHTLYHFTDSSNIDSILNEGIYSNKQLQVREIEFTPGGNTLSQELDQQNKLDDYVHLCLTPHHPMAHDAQNRGSIKDPKFLKISPTILDSPNIAACMHVSVSSTAKIISLDDALSEINWTDWTSFWNNDAITGLEDFANNPIFKIEILVPKHIASSYLIRS